ncbi:MAG: DUF4349 domain-containing protein [Planctomycetes bacterium]|nr:DUF4349 domain-containing protein [Planctomycetota bacterium]
MISPLGGRIAVSPFIRRLRPCWRAAFGLVAALALAVTGCAGGFFDAKASAPEERAYGHTGASGPSGGAPAPLAGLAFKSDMKSVTGSLDGDIRAGNLGLFGEAPDVLVANQGAPGPDVVRKVIYTANLSVTVKEVEAAQKKAEEIAESFGGHLQQLAGDTITVRVPSDKFKEALARVEALGTVTDRNVNAQDVTEEFVDLEARLKNALASRDRLLDLIKRADDVKAIVELEKELRAVGEEIERLQGKLRFLQSQVSMCTITLRFARTAQAQAPVRFTAGLPFGWLRLLDPNSLLEN